MPRKPKPSIEYWIPAPKQFLKKASKRYKYEISSHGRVKRDGVLVTPYLNNRYTRLVVNIGSQGYVVHTMVATIFLKYKFSPHIIVVHKDRDITNNDKKNLKIVDKRFQSYDNMEINKTSKFRGVSRHTNNHKWVVQISIKAILVNLGYYEDEEYASEIYKNATENTEALEELKSPALFREHIKRITHERMQKMPSA